MYLKPSMRVPHLDELTPREIVRELDKYVIGQAGAKRAVAIALRNRIRRQKLPPEMAEEVMPKNIIMIGPTGVGKTEIARRLAKLANSPFLKVEASKFTEVGYVGPRCGVDDSRSGGDCDRHGPQRKARGSRGQGGLECRRAHSRSAAASAARRRATCRGRSARAATEQWNRTREKLRAQLRDGKLDDRTVEIEVKERNFPAFEIITNQGIEEMDINIKDILPGFLGQRTKKRKMKVDEAMDYLIQEEEQKLVDMDQVTRLAVERVENSGIIFLDEIDKIAGRESGHGPDVSREGVQRDILPIVEGTTVNTRYGMVRTDHILFIAAGAFHVSKPADLIPELQGRFPIRVELDSLTDRGFRSDSDRTAKCADQTVRRAARNRRHQADVSVDDAVQEIARFATTVNENTENIGARRLHTIMEKLLDEISFEGPDLKKKTIRIDAAYVQKMLADIVKDQDLSRYIL